MGLHTGTAVGGLVFLMCGSYSEGREFGLFLPFKMDGSSSIRLQVCRNSREGDLPLFEYS
jgi:hypothetical protein